MHMKGRPVTMQNSPHYDDIIDEMLSYFENKFPEVEVFGKSSGDIDLTSDECRGVLG